jgi:hypothetical protein
MARLLAKTNCINVEREREREKEVERARERGIKKCSILFNNLTFFCKFFYKASLE